MVKIQSKKTNKKSAKPKTVTKKQIKSSKTKKAVKAQKEKKQKETKFPLVKKIKTHVPGFDSLFKEGIPEGSAVLLEGGPGSGKTTFCLQLIHEVCMRGGKALYMSFEEPEIRLKQHMMDFGWEPDKYEENGQLMLKRFNALDIARSVEALLSEAKKELLIDIQPVLIPSGFEPDLVCIDSLSSIASAFSGEENRFRIYMEQLFRYLESHQITSFLIRESPRPTHLGNSVSGDVGEAVSFLSDGIICIYNVIHKDGSRGRAIEVLKMRGEDIDRRIVDAKIVDKKGYVINPKKQIGQDVTLT